MYGCMYGCMYVCICLSVFFAIIIIIINHHRHHLSILEGLICFKELAHVIVWDGKFEICKMGGCPGTSDKSFQFQIHSAGWQIENKFKQYLMFQL